MRVENGIKETAPPPPDISFAQRSRANESPVRSAPFSILDLWPIVGCILGMPLCTFFLVVSILVFGEIHFSHLKEDLPFGLIEALILSFTLGAGNLIGLFCFLARREIGRVWVLWGFAIAGALSVLLGVLRPNVLLSAFVLLVTNLFICGSMLSDQAKAYSKGTSSRALSLVGFCVGGALCVITALFAGIVVRPGSVLIG